jgi:Zn-dependent peptidase ImmA (M78 family)
MNKNALAKEAGITPTHLSGLISGKRNSPSQELIGRLAEILNFPPEFFCGPELDTPSPESSSFRALSSISAKMRDKVMAAVTLGISFAEWLDQRFNVPQPDVPDLSELDPETAAMELRGVWDLSIRPVDNMVHLLEEHGVKVFSLAEDTLAVDAFSFWRDGVPFVFLNTMKSAERSRMDAAHELGHLVLHRSVVTQRNREAEKEAQQFGSAFLMPRESVVAHVPRGASILDIIELKSIWIVSVANLAYRMKELGLLSENQSRWMFQRIGQLGYRTKEPKGAPRERSAVLTQVFELLEKQGKTVEDVARDLSLYPDELGKLIWGTVPFFEVVKGQDEDPSTQASTYIRII